MLLILAPQHILPFLNSKPQSLKLNTSELQLRCICSSTGGLLTQRAHWIPVTMARGRSQGEGCKGMSCGNIVDFDLSFSIIKMGK